MEEVQKEMRVRKRISNIYNKRRDDFNTKDEWDDYLEMVEDLIFNIVNRVDVPETEAKIAEYERGNRLAIISNQARMAAEQKALQQEVAAAAAGPKTEQPAAPASAVPPPFKPATALLAAQPLPVKQPAVDADGRLIWKPSHRNFEAMAAASGWAIDLPKARALQEAFASILL